MDYVYLSIISAMAGTLSMILVYVYLYPMYRERYISIWAIAWSILFLRNILFDSGILTWKQSILGFTIYQLLFISCSVIFVWGTYIFVGKPMNKRWLYGAIIASLLSVLFLLLQVPMPYKLIPPAWFGGIVLIWLAIFFLRHSLLNEIGRLITGTSFALWSALTMTMPFFIETIPLLIAVGGGILRLIIAVSTVMIFLEKARADLIHKEKQYRLLAENAADIIYYYQFVPNAKMEYISPSVFSLTGYTPEEYYADNQLLFSIIYPDDRHFFDNFINHSRHTSTLPLTLRLFQKNQTILWVEEKCVPIYDNAGNIIALEGIMRDITARKQLDQISSQFDRMNMVGNMAATVAHEIRNPITTIRGYLQLMESKQEYQADKDKIELMINEIDHANTIIREYLSLSQKKVSKLHKCSLNQIIISLFSLIQANALSSNVYVNLNLNDLPSLWLDENEIRQLLLNLVRNGIEAMPAGGQLIINTIRQNNHTVALSVHDQGPGIPTNILDKLGTPFVTTKDTGTGLGLPICYQIVRRHNATLTIVTNEQGTTVSVCFHVT